MIGITPRRVALAFALLAAPSLGTIGLVGTAVAQSACGPELRVIPGDTLSRIARNCGVSTGALQRANPAVDWSRLRVGARIALPEAPPPRAEAPRPGRGADVYVIRRGDTLRTVAEALGVSVDALLRVNPGLSQRDLIPGREVRLGDRGSPPPPPADDIDISVEEDRVEPGDVVTIDVEGLPARAPVRVRAGPEGGRGLAEGRARAGRDGSATVEIDVPDRARPGERWFVELVDPNGRTLARDRFRIAGREGPRPDAPRSITVRGLLTREGVECPALRSTDGALYTLSGPTAGFEVGDSVIVSGRIAEMSTCQQGTTIDVDRIEGR